jgi:hypothetical protein
MGTREVEKVVGGPAATFTVSVRAVKFGALVRTETDPAGTLVNVYEPELVVVAERLPTATVAPAIGAPLVALVIVPANVPVDGGRGS